MASMTTTTTATAITAETEQKHDERAGAETVYGEEDCKKHSVELLEELGFPKGLLPLKDMVECGRVKSTGFVWMKQKAPSEHYFEKAKALVSYAEEVTAYVEEGKMKRMTGVKSKPMLFWLTVTEMSIDDSNKKKIHFKSSLGVGRTFRVTAFMDEEEKAKYLAASKNIDDGVNDNIDDENDYGGEMFGAEESEEVAVEAKV